VPYRKRPTRGSMAFYPKKRARRIYPRIKSWPEAKDAKPLGFAGYKAGMTHVLVTDGNPNSKTKGQQIARPVTILECPPISVLGFRCYTGRKTSFDVLSEKFSKNLSRKMKLAKEPKKVESQLSKIPADVSKVTLICHTNCTFKKKPEVFEIGLGGKFQDQMAYAKEMVGKDIKVSDTLKDGDLVDVVAVTTGHGFQGPMRRFGVKGHPRRAQQMERHVGSLGQNVPGKVRWNVPQGGQLGFQTRTEFNKKILKILSGFKVKGGLVNYGDIEGDCVLVEGSVPGPKKRLIRLRVPIRPKKSFPGEVNYISMESQQGA
jgi:large subunit ribosomal protein L3